MSEERRLAYVGLDARAMQRLYITRSETRTMWGKSQFNPPSPFLEEIPEELIEWRRLGGFAGFGASGMGHTPTVPAGMEATGRAAIAGRADTAPAVGAMLMGTG